jgi:phosphatidylserine/phosphatidylglycerophosphate/cardiolipin synthase-like enzyme
MRLTSKLLAFALLPLLLQCKTPDVAIDDGTGVKSDETYAAGGVLSLPTLTDPAPLVPVVEAALDSRHLGPEDAKAYAEKLAHYLAFLGLTPGSSKTKTVLSRLLGSSTEFLLCDSFEDWSCLEQPPRIKPGSSMRVDKEPGLGEVVQVAAPLRIEAYFTDQWDKPLDRVDWSKMLALRLAEKITTKGKAAVSVAIYGIDKIDGSMKAVYEALLAKARAGVPVRAVFDTLGVNKAVPAGEKLNLTYRRDPGRAGRWAFDAATPTKTNISFLYDGTASLLNALNEGIADDGASKARVEWPDSGIMHNKFLVLDEGGGRRGVWTGTANVADTCMGAERNSNVGIYIDNSEVADAYQAEFEEMFAFREALHTDNKVVNGQGQPGVAIGSFHGKKTPNSKRYFRFADGHELRVHFAPTDDGEHRAILPMLHSARRGDTVRIAMFGAAGIELVRAMQAAAARGVTIRMLLDCATGSQTAGTIRDKAGNLLDANPYLVAEAALGGGVTIRRSTKNMKLNHHKSATLTRADGRTEVIIIGSQNWSASGNDKNDENMVTMRTRDARDGDVPVGVAFNEHFDTRLWPSAAIGEMKPGIPYDQQNKCDGGAPDADDSEGDGDGEGESVVAPPG